MLQFETKARLRRRTLFIMLVMWPTLNEDMVISEMLVRGSDLPHRNILLGVGPIL